MAELLLEPRELRERLLELAVLERDAGLVRERVEQPQVVVVEGRAFAHPVDHEDRADGAGLTDQRARHRLLDVLARRTARGLGLPQKPPARS